MESCYFKKTRLQKQSHDYYRNLSEKRIEKNIQGINARICLIRKSKKESIKLQNHYKANKNNKLND